LTGAVHNISKRCSWARERALLEFLRGGFVLWQDAVGIAGDDFRHALDQIGRVEPILAQGVEPLGCSGDGLSARVSDVGGGGDVWCQALGEGEGLEGSRGGVARVIAYTKKCAHPK